MIYIITIIISLLLVILVKKFGGYISKNKKILIGITILIVLLIMAIGLNIARGVASYSDYYFYSIIEIKPIEEKNSQRIYLRKSKRYNESYRYVKSTGKSEYISFNVIEDIATIKGNRAYIKEYREEQAFDIWTFGWYPVKLYKYKYVICLPSN